MPAISPARLKQDVADLIGWLPDNAVFARKLDDLLDRYADRTYRKAESGRPGSLLLAYHVPRPVLRGVYIGLASYPAETPEAALELADELWERPYYEPKYLAARLAGGLPESFARQVMERIETWLAATDDDELQAELVRIGLEVDEAGLAAIIEGYLDEGGDAFRTGLSALGAVARIAPGEALPGLYRLFGKTLENPGADRNGRLLNLARGLAERSPVETAYFLRHQYLISMRPEIARLLRQVLPLLPDQLRTEIRRMLRENQ
jgi:hypothetical protein